MFRTESPGNDDTVEGKTPQGRRELRSAEKGFPAQPEVSLLKGKTGGPRRAGTGVGSRREVLGRVRPAGFRFVMSAFVFRKDVSRLAVRAARRYGSASPRFDRGERLCGLLPV